MQVPQKYPGKKKRESKLPEILGITIDVILLASRVNALTEDDPAQLLTFALEALKVSIRIYTLLKDLIKHYKQ